MRLTAVGCSGSFPGPDSPASCYLLESQHDGRTWRLVLDLGNGALGPLQRHTDLLDVDAVLLSHLHADHCLDLCPYYVVRRYHPRARHDRLPVYGPADTRTRMNRAYDLAAEPGLDRELAFRTWTPSAPVTLGPYRIHVARVAHPGESYAMRIECAGRVLTYSGDTGPCDALVALAQDADLFLCEASFTDRPDNPPDLHLSGRQAGEHAAKADVRRLLLTHVPAWADAPRILAEAAKAYPGPTELAQPGSSYDV